ncbi:MAG: lipocalin family protein [Ferruginibacter sp.]
MKKLILAVCVLASLASCKKDDNNNNNCEKSVAGIAATYKITKAVIVATGIPDQDVTTSWLTDCERNGIYILKSDKTLTYTESGTCSDSGTGVWDVVDGKLTLTSTGGTYDFSGKTISSWDCTTFVVSDDLGGATYKIYFTKQ